jgi:hypothetical protein
LRLTLHTDTFLDTSISSHCPDLAVYNGETLLVVLSTKLLACNSHTNGIGDTLTEGTGSNLNTGELDLGMSSCHSVVDRGVIVFDLI